MAKITLKGVGDVVPELLRQRQVQRRTQSRARPGLVGMARWEDEASWEAGVEAMRAGISTV